MGEGLGVRAQLAEDDLHLLEFQSIITAFERLPPQDERDPDLVAERRREQVVAKRRLADLVDGFPGGDASASRRLSASSTAIPPSARSFDALDRLLDAQSYRLSSFRTAGEEINYRRFFAINELAAVRQEVPEVFAAAHALLLRLIASGEVTGLRIDHPDGLWDPAGYFRDLQRAAWLARNEYSSSPAPGPEGIPARVPSPSERGEGRGEQEMRPPLPSSRAGYPQSGWRLGVRANTTWTGKRSTQRSLTCGQGKTMMVSRWPSGSPSTWSWRRSWSRGSRCQTTGQSMARWATSSPASPPGSSSIRQISAPSTISTPASPGRGGGVPSLPSAYEAKGLMLRTALASETNVLARALNRISEQSRRTRDFTLSALRNALREVITAFPVYRTYIVCNGRDVSDRDRRAIERAVALAKRRNPASDPSVFDFLEDVLLLRDDGALSEQERDERCRFVMKFQQLTGPVMAKGVEDTAFYSIQPARRAQRGRQRPGSLRHQRRRVPPPERRSRPPLAARAADVIDSRYQAQ